jgi:hypothetical protein
MSDTSGLLGNGTSQDPAVRLEDLQVHNARDPGWSWADIVGAVGVSEQAVHRKHAGRHEPARRQ